MIENKYYKQKINKMKKNGIAVIVLGSILLMSFALTSEVENRKSELNISNESSEDWKTTSCFRYLQYDVIKKSYGNEWAIESKNGYNQSISMSVKIIDGYGGDRFTIPAGETRRRSMYYTNNKEASHIRFEVNKVKFGDTGFSGPYADCDH